MAVETVGSFYIAADFSSWLVGFADVSFPPPEEEPPPPQPVSIMIAAASTNKINRFVLSDGGCNPLKSPPIVNKIVSIV